MLNKGLVQIYTGNGKGKTTAALGLALRAAGWKNKVLIYQFLKPAGLDTGERSALKLCNMNIHLESLDIPWDMKQSFKDPAKISETKSAIKTVLSQINQSAQKKLYDVIILDEIIFCLSKGLAELNDIRDIIEKKDPAVEIVMTGRGASADILELADLVTEMKNIKHPFDKGIKARKGIDY